MRPRSIWVSVWAWLLIVLSSLAVLLAALPVWLLWSTAHFDGLQESLLQAWQASQQVDSMVLQAFVWLLRHWQWVALATLVVALWLLVSAVGMWRRNNLARRHVVALLLLAALYQLLSIAGTFWLMADLQAAVQAASLGAQAQQGALGMAVLPALIALAQLALAWWLCRPHVVAEFNS